MKIVYVRPYNGEESVVRAALPEHEIVFVENLHEITDVDAMTIEMISVFVDTKLDQEVLGRFSGLKCITARSAGFDHIDRSFTKERGIVISRVPHYGSQTVAEYVFALMFALSRNAYQASIDYKHAEGKLNLDAYEGFDLSGKLLGVVGTGLIGQKVCAIAKSFGMKVVACDQYPNDTVKAMDITYLLLHELLSIADVITLHVPGKPETHHLINADCFTHMKKTAYLINTARGEVVDTKALLVALHSKQIAGAGLDVLEYEHALALGPALSNEQKQDVALMETIDCIGELMKMKNVIVTPHIGFDTKEAKAEITEITIANIRAIATGSPVNIVF